MQDVKLCTKCMSVGLRISDSRREWVQSGVIFNPENIFFKWCGQNEQNKQQSRKDEKNVNLIYTVCAMSEMMI